MDSNSKIRLFSFSYLEIELTGKLDRPSCFLDKLYIFITDSYWGSFCKRAGKGDFDGGEDGESNLSVSSPICYPSSKSW